MKVRKRRVKKKEKSMSDYVVTSSVRTGGGCQAIQLREGLTGPQRAGVVGVEGQKHSEMSDFANEDRCARNSRQPIQ